MTRLHNRGQTSRQSNTKSTNGILTRRRTTINTFRIHTIVRTLNQNNIHIINTRSLSLSMVNVRTMNSNMKTRHRSRRPSNKSLLATQSNRGHPSTNACSNSNNPRRNLLPYPCRFKARTCKRSLQVTGRAFNFIQHMVILRFRLTEYQNLNYNNNRGGPLFLFGGLYKGNSLRYSPFKMSLIYL